MSSLLTYIQKSPITHILMTVTFLSSGIILNILQGTLYYFLRPVVFLGEWWSGSDIIVYIDKDEFKKYYGKEHGYLILNHTYDVDWIIGFIFCERVRVLGNCKAYAKKSIQYVPTMGWAWKFSESVFLERNWDKDKDMIGRQVAQLAQYPDPMFLLLFAEGTRFTPEKHKASTAFAIEKGLPVLKHHLTPRTKGFISSVAELRGKVPAIYNIQIGFEPNAKVKPTVMNLLLGKPIVGHMFFERIPIDSVPEDDEGAALWLRELYNKKDRMMDSFLKTGDYFATSGVPRLEGIKIQRRPFTLINFVLWAIVTLIPIIYGITCLLTSGSTFYVSLGLFIISMFLVLGYVIIEQTKIDKGSSYGKKTETPTKHRNGSSQ